MTTRDTMLEERLLEPRLGIEARSERAEGKEGEQLPGILAWVVALAMAQAVIALDLQVPLVRPVLGLLTVLGVPTLMLYRKSSLPGDPSAKALYSFGASLLGLMVLALALNASLPALGIEHPLQPAVLAVTWFVVDVALLAWRRNEVPLPAIALNLRKASEFRIELTMTLAVGSTVLAAVGAIRLNNGAGGEVSLLAHVVGGAALVALMLRSDSAPRRDIKTLTLVAAGLLLATSLRGWQITGHDIQAEYLAFRLTNGDQHWSMEDLQNAYNACLSVNILPTVLAQTTGLSGVAVFKVLLQLCFALVPALTYLLSLRFLPRRLALGAAIFTMAFPTFFTDMPYLVRQEIAFFFLALTLLAATERNQPVHRVRALMGLFGVGVVLSHYSTTYLMLLGLVGGLAMLMIWRGVARVFGRDSGIDRASLTLLSPAILVFLTVTSLFWAGPVTHTGDHAKDVARAAAAAIVGNDGETPGSSDLSWGLFTGGDASPRERLDLFVEETLQARRNAPDADLLIKPLGSAELTPDIVAPERLPLTAAGRALNSIGISAVWVNGVARFGSAISMQVFLLLGLVGTLVLLRKSPRRERTVPVESFCAAVGALGALGLVALIPSLSVEYGVLRAFQQTLLFTAPVMAAGMWILVRRYRRGRSALCVIVPISLLFILCGVAPAVLGGNPARLALENSGTYYDRYLASDADVRTMSWLAATGSQRDSDPDVIASRNNGIRIVTLSRQSLEAADRLYPTLLTRGSYVFADSHLVLKRQSTIFYSGDLITYVYPLAELDRRLDQVYSAGHSRVYR